MPKLMCQVVLPRPSRVCAVAKLAVPVASEICLREVRARCSDCALGCGHTARELSLPGFCAEYSAHEHGPLELGSATCVPLVVVVGSQQAESVQLVNQVGMECQTCFSPADCALRPDLHKTDMLKWIAEDMVVADC